MNRENMKKGFTLAEIMIALVVIGVITSILLPVAFNNVPNENVMKFKKGNATLAKVINELVTSGEYYKEGDLGVRSDGTLVDGTHDEDKTYFCKTMGDILNTKSQNCSSELTGINGYIALWQQTSIDNEKDWLDKECSFAQNKLEAEIITNDNIIFYQSAPASVVFGMNTYELNKYYCTTDLDAVDKNNSEFCINAETVPKNRRAFGNERDINNIDVNYKTFCIDIDGLNKGEDPFGYGIRVDGKIILGARAQKWLEKSIQEK